jgi:hypothetical protein
VGIDEDATDGSASDRVLPTSVRASLGVTPSESENEARTLEVEGQLWAVRVVGRSSGGRTVADVSLAEVEFAPVDDDNTQARRLIVVESKQELSDSQLEELLARDLRSSR